MNTPYLPKRQKVTRLRMVGSVLVMIGIGGLLWAQLIMEALPIAVASEAPDRHLAAKETFTRGEAYSLSFALAQDIRQKQPNVLWPIVPLLLGGYMLLREANGKSAFRQAHVQSQVDNSNRKVRKSGRSFHIIQRYLDSSEIHVGHRVIYNGQVGTIVFVVEHEEYSPEFPKDDWDSIKTGFMIRFDNGALSHHDRADEHLTRDKNQTATGNVI